MKRCKIHTYKKIKRRKAKNNSISNYIFACIKCTHYITDEFILGKLALCALCGNEYNVNLYAKHSLKLLHCDACTKRAKTQKEADDFVQNLMEKIGVK